jgi:predicted short-subunit dehydrogenase-like oxidoreductase (DUF2520 family)
MKIQSAVIIGSGNVATHLGRALKKAGVSIDVVYSRGAENARVLASELGAVPYTDLKLVPAHADLYLIAVKDSVIESVASQLHVNDGLVVHTSGITPIEVLYIHKRHGVFYPLQTLTKNVEADLKSIPLLIETNNEEDREELHRIASLISDKTFAITSEQRQFVHLAAVFTNNFSNHLYAIAEQITQAHGIPFEILKPLILETARKVQHHSPQSVQTGPAIRNDLPTIEKHLLLLQQTPDFRQIYEQLSRSIHSLQEVSSGKND